MMSNKKIIESGLLTPLMWLLFLLYDILFLLGLIFYFPVYLYRKKINFEALKEKLGFVRLENKYKNCIWIHVVSVGEAQLIGAFVTKLRQQFNHPIVISTTTLTGNRVAKQKYAKIAKVIYFPYDSINNTAQANS